ncbi:MAG: RNA 2',3'-cyclic phosphodiesterase, partial [Legionella longbeachae]|nr:RNA 2',3'-cyclic phosphodiesterase [Legionella longbeachae]
MSTHRVFFAIVPPKETQVQLFNILQTLKQAMPAKYIRWI